ncbi:class I SAM-dependent methyltransferase [Xanthobacter sp. DSM 24535]|uniref:class I SAM-dependent methyltransferase n=1 Tax=Roseixanthobacter psychrophilus TaxID=3119917 RepID=UPI003727CCF8
MSDSDNSKDFQFSHDGICPVCEASAKFSASGPYFRGTLICSNCKSVPRHRAIMHVLKTYFPNWAHLSVHESSPGWDMVSQRLVRECSSYTASQYNASVPFGSIVDAPRMLSKSYRSENLEAQTFEDEQFDLVITQDVFEHIFYPDKAIKEIARTLKPGGATLMTVPIILKNKPSRRRAALQDGKIRNILEPQFHGNPLGNDGSLVTIDWGYDIVSYLQHHSGLSFLMVQIDNIDLGIRADLIEVLIGFKRPIPAL